jgi:glycine dehydrogenase subunit 2
MAGFQVRNIASGPDGCVDLEAFRAALGPDTAGLMLTNPNTLGLFDPKILEITGLVHQAGGLCYYDGANLNAVMGIARPGDMGFDAVHLNLHKSFSTPHGGGGPGSGAVGCKDFLAPFLPLGAEIPGISAGSAAGLSTGASVEESVAAAERALSLEGDPEARPQSIGRVRAFYGNFLVVVKAAAYLLSLGKEGIPAAARDAVLNANYLMEKIRDSFPPAYPGPCMHEFVISLEELKRSRGVSALDLAKALEDRGMHPPTIYFPLIVHEAMMLEPTETESKETLDEAAAAFRSLYDEARKDPEKFHASPLRTVIGRPDDVKAARQPVLRYTWP